MKVNIEKIKVPWYAPREEYNEEFLNELGESMSSIGLLDDVILRRNGDFYEVIAGSQRIKAAITLGWREIEAKVFDISEKEAAVIAIQSNLVRDNLQQIEEGKAIKRMIDRLKLTQREIADLLHKSESWVSNRLSLALNIAKEVQQALIREDISVTHAVIISRLEESEQVDFLRHILKFQKDYKRKITPEETRDELKRFKNDTIYTIGYSGWNLNNFIKTLKDNEIEYLIDIRQSGSSTRKPEFARTVLKHRLDIEKIKLIDRSDLGVPFEIRRAGMEGGLSWECFTQWYKWHVTKSEGKDKASELAEKLKDIGKSVLMCSEHYPTAMKGQEHGCHRDILVKLIMDTKLFKNRKDIV
ncbi:MAG: ParB/RepB/Spo0J family partition protein [Candidatus Hodarchaeota archaeon]